MSDETIPGVVGTIVEEAALAEPDDTEAQQEIATIVFDEYAGIAPE